jgi:hypothetical protein
MIKIYDNFLPEWLHNRVKEQLLNPYFNWNFPSFGNIDADISTACFTNTPYIHNQVENFKGCDALRYALDCWLFENKDIFELEYLSRCLINFYTPGQNTGWHQDIPDDKNVYSLIYYVTNSDGGTEFENNKQIVHKENRLLFFNSSKLHTPITSTLPRRISVNWIMKGKIKNETI